MGDGFAVIDFETTGLFPSRQNRVIEIGVVLTDRQGKVQETWETLVNPERDLGKQSIHGIRAADVLDAPLFAEIAPLFIQKISGRVLVAHNSEFDSRFLFSELERAGYDLWQKPEFVCTMRLAHHFLPGSGRALQDCCDALDIQLSGAHRAINDAFATAQLLEAYIASSGADFWLDFLNKAKEFVWPALTESYAELRTKIREEGGDDSLTARDFLQNITVKLPEITGPASYTTYLGMLDQALIDRHISLTESRGLVELAERLGIDRQSVVDLHYQYLSSLVDVAWQDGVVTEAEVKDLDTVSQLLNIPEESLALMISERAAVPALKVATNFDSHFILSAGDIIALTGEMSLVRSEIENQIQLAGFIPGGAVTKKVKLLVAADPDSLSGKAKKARDYGIPVIGETALWDLLAK